MSPTARAAVGERYDKDAHNLFLEARERTNTFEFSGIRGLTELLNRFLHII